MKLYSSVFIIFVAFQLNFVTGIYYSKKAENNQFPYNVLIDGRYSFCTGALISESYVLTAAHCLRKIPKGGNIKVVVGSSTLYDPDKKTMFADTFWMHENFTMPSAVYDVGIIKLPEPLIAGENIQWIKVSTKVNADLDDEDKEVEIAGWGYTENYRGIADELRYTKMNLIPLKDCEKYKIIAMTLKPNKRDELDEGRSIIVRKVERKCEILRGFI